VRDAFQVELPLKALFEGPSIAELAVVVEHMLSARQMGAQKIEQLKEKIRNLSDEEVRTLLEQKRAALKAK
jgi:hypothetical protein